MVGGPADAFALARARMVAEQLRGRGIRDEGVLRAMAQVPRERFVPAERRDQAYDDSALPIGSGQTISQPYVVARMTELLTPRRGDRVLEVGTGSGYQAAVLATLGCRVVTVERDPELAAAARRRLEELDLADRVEVRVGDGSLGDPDGAPYPRIIVTAAAPRVPPALRQQLDPRDGRMVIPVGSRWDQELLLVVREGDTWMEIPTGRVVFVPLVGREGFPPEAVG